MHSVGASNTQRKQTSSRASKCLNRFLRLLTWSSGYPKYFQYLFLIASNIQYILLLLHLQLRHFDHGQNSGLALTVNKICKAFLLRNLTTCHLDGWIFATYLYLGSLLSGICFLGFMAFRNQKIPQKVKHVILTISQFHLSTTFWLCNAILAYTLTNARDGYTKFFQTSFEASSLVAWHIFLLVMNFMLSGTLSMYSYDPLKWSNDLAMSTPISQFLTFAFKGIICLTLLLIGNETAQKWTLGLFSLVISCYRHFHLLARFPYYEHRPLKLSLLMSSVAVMVSFLSVLILCFHEVESLNGNAIFYIEAFLICLWAKCNHMYFENKVVKYLAASRLKSEDDVLKTIFALYYIKSNVKLTVSQDEPFDLREVQFWGVWSSDSDQHKTTSFTEKIKAIFVEMDVKIYELLSSSIEKYKENKKLKLFLVNFILHQNEGMLRALDYLQQLRRSQGGFNRLLSAILWEQFQKKLNQKYEGNLDIKTFLHFEESSQTFIEMIYSNSKLFLEFWKTYTKSSLDLMDLATQSEIIEQNDTKITAFWNKFELKEKYLHKQFLMLYSVYLSIIRNSKYAASKLRTKLNLYEQNLRNNLELTHETLMSTENISFHISMEKENFGKILRASENAAERLGWRKDEFTSKTIEMMLPKFLRKESMKILRGRDGKTWKDPRFNQIIDCFLVNSQNWIIPCDGFYCLYPKIKEEFKILALFRVKSFYGEIIIVGAQRIIQGATEKIGQLLGLQGIGMISLEDVCLTRELNENTKKLSLNRKGDRNKVILKNCDVSVEEYSLKEKYIVLRFASKDVLKAEKHQKTLLQTKESIPDQEDEEAIPSERFEWTVNSPVSTTRNLLTQRVRFTARAEERLEFSTESKRIISSPDTPDDLFFPTKKKPPGPQNQPLQRQSSRRTEEYLQEPSMVSSQASSQRIELEQALHFNPKDNSIRVVSGFFRLYLLTAILLLIIFKVVHANSIDTVTKNTEISTAALLRLVRICNVFAQAGAFIRVDEGVAFADRYAFVGLLNFKRNAANGMPAIIQNLLDANNKLRQYVSKIEEKFYENLYTQLPMYFYNAHGDIIGSQMTNPFDLVTQLVARGDRITKMSVIKGYSEDVMFIYKNSVDKLLVLSEQGLSVIADDTEAKLNQLFNTTIYFFVVIGVFGSAFFCFFLYVANQILQDQEKTFELFRRLDEQEIVNYLKTVDLFCSILSQSDMNIQLAAKKIQQKPHFLSEISRIKPATLQKGKRLQKKGVYSTLIQIVFVVSILLLVIFSGYIIILVLVKSQNDTINTKVNLLVSFNYQAYEDSLLKFVQPEYLAGHLNMTLRSQPFIQEWDKTYKRNLAMGESLLQIIDPEKGFGEDERLAELVNGDLCELIETDIIIKLKNLVGDPCDRLLGGLARKGVKPTYDFGMYWMDLMMSNFEASNRAKIDSIKALNSTVQRQYEMMFLLYVRPAMEKISHIMEAQLQKDAQKGIHAILVVVIVYIVISVTVVSVIWHKVQRVFSAQKIKWRRLFKLVPKSIILANKALTLYLLKNRSR